MSAILDLIQKLVTAGFERDKAEALATELHSKGERKYASEFFASARRLEDAGFERKQAEAIVIGRDNIMNWRISTDSTP